MSYQTLDSFAMYLGTSTIHEERITFDNLISCYRYLLYIPELRFRLIQKSFSGNTFEYIVFTASNNKGVTLVTFIMKKINKLPISGTITVNIYYDMTGRLAVEKTDGTILYDK
jgi:hypothetical protein